MNYEEAEAFLKKHKELPFFSIYNNPPISVTVDFTIIAPKDKVSEVKDEYDKNGGFNKEALEKLGLINGDLKVFMVGKTETGHYRQEDMYEYLRGLNRL